MKNKTGKILIAVCVILIAVIILAAVPAGRRAAAESGEDSIQSIKDTIMQRSLQCYVIEGAYPQDLEYLEENYGLTVNKEDYLIVYTPFAENLPPEVRVLDRRTQSEG